MSDVEKLRKALEKRNRHFGDFQAKSGRFVKESRENIFCSIPVSAEMSSLTTKDTKAHQRDDPERVGLSFVNLRVLGGECLNSVDI